LEGSVARVYDREITQLVESMQKEGLDVGLDGQYGKFRITTKEGGRYLSPRADNRQILDWLWAYRDGFRAGVEAAEKVRG
jgi:hypothetical protein